MNCNLNDKVLRAYRTRVAKDLIKATEAKTPFDLKAYLNEKYAMGLEVSKGDNAVALDFAMVTPQFIWQVIGSKDNFNDLDLDVRELRKLMIDFASDKGIEIATDYLNLKSDIGKELGGKVEIKEGEGEKKPPVDMKKHADVSHDALVEINRDGKYRAYAPSFLTDSEWETLEVDPKKPNYNVPDPAKAFYFKVKRGILQALGGAENGSEIDYKGQGPVFLKAVEVSTLQESDKKPISTDKISQEELDKGIALVVVDKAGQPLRFDRTTGDISDTGSVVYFSMRNTAQFFKNGEFALTKSENERAAVIANHMSLSLKDAKEYLKNQILFIDAVRNYVKKNPDNNSVMMNITGGSFGYPSFDFEARTKIKEINFGKTEFNPTAEKSQDGHFFRGQFYFLLNNNENTPIKIDSPYLKDTEYVDALINLLTEKVYDSLGSELTPAQVKKHLQTYLYLTKERLDYHENGTVSLRGVTLDTSTAEGKQKTKAILREYFTELTHVRKLGRKPGYKKDGTPRQVAKTKADYKMDMAVKDGDGNYWVIEHVRLNGLDRNIHHDFDNLISVEPNAQGNYVIETETKAYNDHILDNWTTPYHLNSNKEIVQVQAYTTFDIVESEVEKVFTESPETQDIPTDIDPSEAYMTMLGLALQDTSQNSDAFKMQKVLLHNLKTDQISPDYAAAVLHEWSMRKSEIGQPNLTDKQMKSITSQIKRYSNTAPTRKVQKDPTLDEGVEETKKESKKKELKDKSIPKTNTPDVDILGLIQDNADDPELSKNFDQKKVDVKATKEQIKAAKTWYENHPLSKHFPFEVLFNMINTSDENSVATWAMHGIRLYKGSDFSDLYHESWHAFSQAFMTEKQRTQLYDSVRTMNGAFRDQRGNTIMFAKANDLQIEEYLAEGFRTYMLSDGKSVTKSKRVNSFFDMILRVLDAMFGNLTWSEVMTDPTAASNTIKDLYDKLRVGDLSQYSFSQENASWDVLNAGIRSSRAEESVKELSYEQSSDVVNIIDSLISDFIDLNNTLAPLTPEEQLEYFTLQAQIGTQSLSETELKEAQAKLDAYNNNPKKRHSFTSTMMNTSKGRLSAYKYVYKQMGELVKNLQSKFDTETNEAKKSAIGKRIQTLEWSIRNFGDLTSLKNNEATSEGDIFDVIAYHQSKSQRFISELTDAVYGLEAEGEAEILLKGREYTSLSNEHSSQDLAKKEVLFLVKSLHELDSKGKPVYNDYGVKKLADFGESWNKLAVTLENTLDTEVMYDKLVELAKSAYPEVSQMLDKLGNPQTKVNSEQTLWSAFTSAFNLARVPLVQLAMEKTKFGFNSKVGEAFGVFKGVGRAWESEFQRTGTNRYISTDDEGNFLNIEAVMKDYPLEDSIQGKEIEFLNALGISITDNDVIRQILREGDVKLGYRAGVVNKIWSKVNLLNETLKTEPDEIGKIRSINDIMRAYPTAGITLNENGNFTVIQKLESQFGDERSNFMVQNAEGNSQFEHMLNNTMTVVVNTINAVDTYQELIAMPHMSHLDIKRNPEIKHNVMFNSIFNLDENSSSFGQKRKSASEAKPVDVKLKMVNLSGALVYDEEGDSQPGVASAKADEFTKLILDIHLTNNPNGFIAEMMRHSDKSTSFATFVTKLNVKGETGTHYIGLENFAGNSKNYHDKGYELIRGYLFGEVARINELKQLEEDNKNNPDFVFDHSYLKAGQDFTIFDDIFLDKSLKKDLLKVEGNLEEYFKTEDGKLLEVRVKNAVAEYFDKQINSVTEKFQEAGYISNNLENRTIGILKKADFKGSIAEMDAMAKDMLIKSTVYNSWIHNVDTLNLFYGNLAQYKTAKQDFHKRNAGIGSTGTLFRTDASMLNYINSTVRRGYAEQEGYEYDPYNGTINTGVIQDVKLRSIYFDELAEGQKQALKKQGLSAKEIKVKLYGEKGTHAKPANDGIMHAYDNMEEGDAQGLISFDMYRILSISQGEWDFKTQEKTYQKIIKGENFDQTQILNIFPPAKYQYWGPLQTTGLPMTAFHKYSLMPLIPGTYKKGSNADIMHRKMLKDKLDYVVFKSGSKMATLSKPSGVDNIYDSNRIIKEDFPITKNVLYTNYLKNQLKINKQFKGKVTFPTQLRKLIEDGLMEYGVPIDFEPKLSTDKRIAKWEALSPEKKLKNNKYKLLKAYEKTVADLTAKKKEKLLKEAGLTEKNGKISGKSDKLWKFVKSELTRQDLADHEIDFIKYQDGELKHDMSLSLSADKIEKLLNALVTRRLIKQKFHGEGLFQTSAAFFERLESKRDYKNPTQEEIDKWGSNDLPGYRIGKDGKTLPAKMKIALQGDYENLLYLNDKNGKPLTVYHEYEVNGIMRRKLNYNESLDRLNELLKDEEWLNMENHREMISIVGVRIPVQGLNSMEFMEVYEFLPKTAGNIVIMPSEIVAKAGSDFDIDKLTMMMPNVSKKYKKPFNNRLLRELGAEYPNLDFSRMNVDIILDALKNGEETYSLTNEDRQILMALDNYVEIDISYNTDENEKGLENQMITNMKNILELPDNYATLTRPNGVDILDPIQKEMVQVLNESDYNPSFTYAEGSLEQGKISPTRVLEIEYNLYKHKTNNIGKQTLGLGAVDNTYNTLFNRINAYLNATDLDGNPQKLQLEHNSIEVDGQEVISLAGGMDKSGENRISDVINQLLNGWLDIAKDAWIFNIQGNKEIAPALLFLVQAGVPIKHAVYMVSTPLVRKYVNEVKKYKSTFAESLGYGVEPNLAKDNAARDILRTLGLDTHKGATEMAAFQLSSDLTERKIKMSEVLEQGAQRYGLESVEFDEALLKRLAHGEATEDEQAAAFVHFMQIEQMAKSVRDVKLRMNLDTKESKSLFEASDRTKMINELKEDGRLGEGLIERLLTDSPISSFAIQDFQLELWKDAFPLRNHKVVNEFLSRLVTLENVNKTLGDSERFANTVKNDLLSYIFQNTFNTVNLDTLKSYRGFEVETSSTKIADIKKSLKLSIGVFMKDGVLYMDKAQIIKDYVEGNYNEKAYTDLGLAKVNEMAFQTVDDYARFVLEREYLRQSESLSTMAATKEFQLKAKIMADRGYWPRLQDESADAHASRFYRGVYEIILRDRALDNSFNSWKLFQSADTFAHQFDAIKTDHPELIEKFPLLKYFAISRNKGFTNIKLIDTQLDAEMINKMHEMFIRLTKPNELEFSDAEEAHRVASFFRKFPIIAFLQSGLSARGNLALGRMVPQEMLLNLMEGPVKAYVEHFDSFVNKSGKVVGMPLVLDDFADQFMENNSNRKFSTMFRHKNYKSDIKLQHSIKAGIQKSEDREASLKKIKTKRQEIIPDPILTKLPGLKVNASLFDPGTLIDATKGEIPMIMSYRTSDIESYGAREGAVRETTPMNEDSVIVYDGAINPRGSAAQNAMARNAVIHHGDLNKQALITRKLFTQGSATASEMEFQDIKPSGELDTKVDPEAKEAIDNSIEALKELSEGGKTLVFSTDGYGQYLIGANEYGQGANPQEEIGGKTFDYLSEQLYSNFGYLNPNWLDRTRGKAKVQELTEQVVTDEMVRDYMFKIC
jgi:hypothetical protein